MVGDSNPELLSWFFSLQRVLKHDRSSPRVLGTVGEAINAKAWLWYHRAVGEGRGPIVDTWWQTETGGIMIAPLPGAWPLKPGSATLPFLGVEPVVLDQEGKAQDGPCAGYLCIKGAWPGMARTWYGDHQRFAVTYFMTWPGYCVTGDGCQREGNGYITLTGRVGDVVNIRNLGAPR
jgi:acetyl-CoA synthetase